MTHTIHKLPRKSNFQFQIEATPSRDQRGFTMVELLVAMVISLFIALAAIAALTATRQGLTTVDAASQLRDNGRFAADLIQRLGVQSGFKDVWDASRPASQKNNIDNIAPSVTGYNNALVSSSDPLNSFTARTAGSVGFGSDILIVRNQLVRLNDNSDDADGSMIDCAGNSPKAGAAPSTRDERMPSVLSVAVSMGEPSLMCTRQSPTTGIWTSQPIIQGIENFQVLYGTDGVTAATAPAPTYGITANTPAPATSAAWTAWAASINQPPDRYLRADQMMVTGGTAAQNAIDTNANWRRVRALRIGMVLRGAPNSAQNAVAQRLYPFGKAKSSDTGADGSALSSDDDKGTVFDAPADGRLRQVLTFTVHLRNDQGL